MDAEAWFRAVEAIDPWLAPTVALVVVLLPQPRRMWLRCILAVVVGWAVALAFTAAVYNPAGIAAGHALGQHFPEARYDNNTFAVTLLAGWLSPALIVGLYALARHGCVLNGAAPNNSSKPTPLRGAA